MVSAPNFARANRLKHPKDYAREPLIIDPRDLGVVYVWHYHRSVKRAFEFPVYRKTTEERYDKKER